MRNIYIYIYIYNIYIYIYNACMHCMHACNCCIATEASFAGAFLKSKEELHSDDESATIPGGNILPPAMCDAPDLRDTLYDGSTVDGSASGDNKPHPMANVPALAGTQKTKATEPALAVVCDAGADVPTQHGDDAQHGPVLAPVHEVGAAVPEQHGPDAQHGADSTAPAHGPVPSAMGPPPGTQPIGLSAAPASLQLRTPRRLRLSPGEHKRLQRCFDVKADGSYKVPDSVLKDWKGGGVGKERVMKVFADSQMDPDWGCRYIR
jgi:hypothetical protein